MNDNVLKVKVLQHHIDAALRSELGPNSRRSLDCPISLALNEQYPEMGQWSTGLNRTRIMSSVDAPSFDLDKRGQHLRRAYDTHVFDNTQPLPGSAEFTITKVRQAHLLITRR